MKELRIIGGKAKGRKIRSVPGDTTRPITDKVREAVFNIIGPDIEGASLLDLFAGTGSVGIEALSRGASYVCFVDLNFQAVVIIRENLITTGLTKNAEVFRSDAFRFLDRPPIKKFDYIYIAPPQYKKMWSQALQSIDRHLDWLSSDAWIIVQIHPVEYNDDNEIMQIKNLINFDQRHYGSTMLIFYRQKNPPFTQIDNLG